VGGDQRRGDEAAGGPADRRRGHAPRAGENLGRRVGRHGKSGTGGGRRGRLCVLCVGGWAWTPAGGVGTLGRVWFRAGGVVGREMNPLDGVGAASVLRDEGPR
jgi:hypothetical protein